MLSSEQSSRERLELSSGEGRWADFKQGEKKAWVAWATAKGRWKLSVKALGVSLFGGSPIMWDQLDVLWYPQKPSNNVTLNQSGNDMWQFKSEKTILTSMHPQLSTASAEGWSQHHGKEIQVFWGEIVFHCETLLVTFSLYVCWGEGTKWAMDLWPILNLADVVTKVGLSRPKLEVRKKQVPSVFLITMSSPSFPSPPPGSPTPMSWFPFPPLVSHPHCGKLMVLGSWIVHCQQLYISSMCRPHPTPIARTGSGGWQGGEWKSL